MTSSGGVSAGQAGPSGKLAWKVANPATPSVPDRAAASVTVPPKQ